MHQHRHYSDAILLGNAKKRRIKDYAEFPVSHPCYVIPYNSRDKNISSNMAIALNVTAELSE